MKYTVILERQVLKQLAKIPKPYYDKIIDALKRLADNPRPFGYKKLINRNGHRIRVNDYRIIYVIKDNELIVIVLDIDNRKDIYE